MEAKFTPTVKDIIQYSREESIRCGNNYIGTEHLLLGILHDGANSALKALEILNVNFDVLKRSLYDVLEKVGQNTEKLIGSIPLTKQAEKVLKISYLEAKIFSSSSITSIHLLLSILRDEDNLAAEKLSVFKVNYETLKRIVEENKDILNGQIKEGAKFEEKEILVYPDNDIKVAQRNSNAPPISLIFDTSEFSKNEIKEMISMLSELYSNISGDYLKVSGMNQFDHTLYLA
ncbi:MAG: Clp protease N-terminal domain-containing protein [Mucilaginibacter sp.]|jgi:ATP-dependent Clp protease ATP-binding subunit ClpA|uniref:Clp protease N-terminal domain-containing protein n=1 Tax=Mucilaginibacter sp. TaxID=1882438 RepID=UPI00356A1AAD